LIQNHSDVHYHSKKCKRVGVRSEDIEKDESHAAIFPKLLFYLDKKSKSSPDLVFFIGNTKFVLWFFSKVIWYCSIQSGIFPANLVFFQPISKSGIFSPNLVFFQKIWYSIISGTDAGTSNGNQTTKRTAKTHLLCRDHGYNSSWKRRNLMDHIYI
jgi:hypothetical protein